MTETPVTIQTPRFTIEGKSRAGNETYFRIRELGIALDIGRCPDILVGLRHIFVTHAHLDHALGIPFYAAQRRLQRLEAGNVYLPLETIEDYAALMKLHEKLEGTQYPLQLVGMSPGDRRPLRRDLDVVAHRSTHRVVCNAWEFVEKRHKLREEYSNQDGPALAQLREEGVDFSDTVEKSLLFYTGDTDRRLLETGGAVFSTEVLMIECSFTAEGEEDRAAQYAHIHLRDIYEFVDQFQNELVVLTHFSLRDSPESIHRLISRTCPASLRDRLRLALPGPLTRL